MCEGVYSHFEIAYREQASGKVMHCLLSAIAQELKAAPDGTLAKKVYVSAPSNARDYKDTSADYQIAFRMTDYVSRMTDAFALAEYQRINAMGATLLFFLVGLSHYIVSP